MLDLRVLGMIPKLMELLFDPEADIRMYAAWVLGTAVQNNPHTQKDVSVAFSKEKLHLDVESYFR
jgi:hypothetical protein